MKEVRDQFNLDPDKIFFDSMLFASHPRPVRDAIEGHQRALDKAPGRYWESNFVTMDRLNNEAAASYLGADPTDIVMTTSATMGLGIFFAGLLLPPDSEVLLSDHEHYSAHEAVAFASRRGEWHSRTISWYENPRDFSRGGCVASLLKQITDKSRLLLLTWVHSSTGVMLPLREIGAAIAALNKSRKESERLILVVDAVHAFGVEDFVVDELHCDALITSCHKWLFGPRGTGIMWLHKRMEQYLTPVIPSYDSASFSNWRARVAKHPEVFAERMSPGGFYNFESRWALKEAFLFHLQIGKSRVAKHSKGLCRYMIEGLEKIPGVQVATPKESACGIVCFDVEGMPAKKVVRSLRKKGIYATTTPYYRVYARFSLSIVNTQEECDVVLNSLGNVVY